MTKEEAINLIADMDSDKYTAKEAVALTMAIKALEQEPCEDCISRQAAIDTLTKTSGIRGDALKAMYDLPPVTPAEKVGHWEYVQYDGNPNIGNWHCSECSAIVNYKPTYNWEKKPYYKYCPNCGAKMQEVEE